MARPKGWEMSEETKERLRECQRSLKAGLEGMGLANVDSIKDRPSPHSKAKDKPAPTITTSTPVLVQDDIPTVLPAVLEQAVKLANDTGAAMVKITWAGGAELLVQPDGSMVMFEGRR